MSSRRDNYLDAYRESHRKHGHRFEVTLWASPQSQRLRFEVMTQMCFMGGRRVLDAGCSRGDFAAYLTEKHIPFSRYIGIDALKGVIDFANTRALANCEFHAGDFLHQPDLLRTGDPDVVCLSGTLNTMSDSDALALLESSWKATRSVLMFNFLSDRCGPEAPAQDDYARRLNAINLLDWALGRTHVVSFRQDYFRAGHDATVMMRKPGAGE